MNRRGLTVLELLVALTMGATLTAAVGFAYAAGLGMDKRISEVRDEAVRHQGIEAEIGALLKTAYVTIQADDTSSAFIADNDGQVSTEQGDRTTRLIFTAFGPPVPRRFLAFEGTFDEGNQRFGPQGGTAEFSLSMVPVGTTDEQGLILREQRPADGDPLQGGYERVLSADVESIGFECFNGTQWQPDWDTRTQGTRRIPAAVRVSYRLRGEETDRVFVVRLPNSDVTADNPLEVNG